MMVGSPFNPNLSFPTETLDPWLEDYQNKVNPPTLQMNHIVPFQQNDPTTQNMSRQSPITPTLDGPYQTVQDSPLGSTYQFPSQQMQHHNIPTTYPHPNVTYQSPPNYSTTVGQINPYYQHGNQTFDQPYPQGITSMPSHSPVYLMHGGYPSHRTILGDKTNRIQGSGRVNKSSSSRNSIKFKKDDAERLMHLLMAHGELNADGGYTIKPEAVNVLTALTRSPTQSMSRTSTRTENPQAENTLVTAHVAFGPISPTRTIDQHQQQAIAREFRGWQKEFRYSDKAGTPRKQFYCTLGCDWSHDKKSNWERHERTHYPPEIWICFQKDCLKKTTKQRVSGRKDLARRHYNDYHLNKNGLPEITHDELDAMKVKVEGSLFPRECVFENCNARFETFEDRLRHIERHLRSEDTLCRGRLQRHFADRTVKDESDDDGQHEFEDEQDQGRTPGNEDTGNDVRDANNLDDGNDDGDGDGDDDDEDEDDDDPDDDRNAFKRHDHNPDGGTGAGGTGSNNWLQTTGGTGGWPNTSTSNQQMQYYANHGNQSYGMAYNFDTFGGNGHIPQTDKRPWKALSSLRLQLLPNVFARGISQTPLVLKKIQLQAAMALEVTGVKKVQVTKILRREIAMMAKAMPRSSQNVIKGLPQAKSITRLQDGLHDTVSSNDSSSLALQHQAVAKFADLDTYNISEKDPDLLEEDTNSDFAQLFTMKGGHIYRCFPVASNMSPIRPTRLIHVGSWSTPKLHLDSSEVLPQQVAFCSVSHCWDDGHGLFLSRSNAASLQKSIPADGLTQTFHLAVNIARDKGVEYLWIDTLCIIQDSEDDIKAEAPRITQIHASATFAIVITSMAYDENAPEYEKTMLRDTSASEKILSAPSLAETMSDMPELTIDDTIDPSSQELPLEIDPKEARVVMPERRDSHQLESFLAEPQKKSFFLPFMPISRQQKTSPPASPPYFKKFLPWSTPDPRPKVIESKEHATSALGYLDKWHHRWQKMSSRSQPQSPIGSREPSISDISLRSEKQSTILTALPDAVEKLFYSLRKKDMLQIGSGEPRG